MNADREMIMKNARVRVMWGDAPDTILHFLSVNGLDEEEAAEMMSDLQKERFAAVRAIAVRKLIVGGCLIAAPIIF